MSDFATLTKGRFVARQATGQADLVAAGSLRARCFGVAGGHDRDHIDDRALHILIEERATGTLVCCYRLLPLPPDALASSYAAQFYDLARLAQFDGLMCELGRFCIHPAWLDPDILRLAWGAMTAFVNARGVRLLFGCSSFVGVDATRYADAFAVLHRRHLAPPQWRVGKGVSEVIWLKDSALSGDLYAAMAQMPPLLRTYLTMGGWVSDHAVVDRQMQTLHVFTGVEIGAIPERRKRLLRALVA